MKQLDLELQKRLFVIEIDKSLETLNIHSWNNQPLEFLCKGPDLTEDIAYELVDGYDLSYFVDYNHHNPRAYKLTALESFISAIESKGYYWGENPEGKLRPRISDYSSLIAYKGDVGDWDKAESRTFNPEKCIIFEIL